MANAIKIALSRVGFEVTVALDPRKAWEVTQATNFDLVITDHSMPSVTGSELCQQLYDSEAHRDVPILILTGMQHMLDREQLAKLSNVVGIVPKPFSPRKLVAQVTGALSARA